MYLDRIAMGNDGFHLSKMPPDSIVLPRRPKWAKRDFYLHHSSARCRSSVSSFSDDILFRRRDLVCSYSGASLDVTANSSHCVGQAH